MNKRVSPIDKDESLRLTKLTRLAPFFERVQGVFFENYRILQKNLKFFLHFQKFYSTSTNACKRDGIMDYKTEIKGYDTLVKTATMVTVAALLAAFSMALPQGNRTLGIFKAVRR